MDDGGMTRIELAASSSCTKATLVRLLMSDGNETVSHFGSYQGDRAALLGSTLLTSSGGGA